MVRVSFVGHPIKDEIKSLTFHRKMERTKKGGNNNNQKPRGEREGAECFQLQSCPTSAPGPVCQVTAPLRPEIGPSRRGAHQGRKNRTEWGAAMCLLHN